MRRWVVVCPALVEILDGGEPDAIVKRFHYDDYDQFRRHLSAFIDAYNYGRRLKTLMRLTP